MQKYITSDKRKAASLLFTLLIIVTSVLYLESCKCNGEGDGICSALTVTIEGAGSGNVTSSPDGIICETDCSESYVNGIQVTLTAAPYNGSVFAGWSGGGCSGTGTCTLIMDGDTTVTASFDLIGTDIANLITPYVNESDMLEIRDGFSTDKSSAPWGFVHDGYDIYPDGDLKPFQAVCDGRVHWMYTGSEQVIVMLACNSTYTAEYNFETQLPQTGQDQLDNIAVAVGQPVSQGDIIGHLYTPNADAHVHFSLYKNWIPTCPEPYLSQDAGNSILNLVRVVFPNADMCYGGNVTPPPLVTPYVNETDMTEINPGFSSENSTSPWGYVHDGIDIYPQGDLKAFQASCSGLVDAVQLQQVSPGSNWQVGVLVQCDDYVTDHDTGGYFIPFSVEYVFEPMSTLAADGQSQLANISVIEGQAVSQGDIIGYLNLAGEGAQVHFGLVQFGSSAFSSIGVTGIPLCPEPHFSIAGKDSILNLLHVAWPGANMCYQE